MMRRKWVVLGTLVAGLLLAGVVVAAPGNHSLDWWVMGGGGGSGTAGSTTLDGTVGQAVAGVDSSGRYVLCAGFGYGLGACGEPPRIMIYLPIALRNAP